MTHALRIHDYSTGLCHWLQGEYIISTRVRCGRSLEGYPFNPCLTEAQYKEMEEKVSSTLSGLEGELKGQFYPLTGMTKEVQQKLIDDHFLFKEGDRFLQVGMNWKHVSRYQCAHHEGT
jgi:protein-arginine kinase